MLYYKRSCSSPPCFKKKLTHSNWFKCKASRNTSTLYIPYMLLVFQNGFWVYIYIHIKKKQEKTFFDSSICRVEINRALKRLEAAKQEGKLEEYLQAPNLLYSMLTHPKMTIDYVERSLMDLFVGGVESVKRSFVFSLTIQDFSFFVHILITTSNILILEMKFFTIKIILHFTSPLIIDIKYFDVLMV